MIFKSKQRWWIVATSMGVALMFFLVWSGKGELESVQGGASDSVYEGDVIVAYVIDGDTIELADETRVRLIGIDTPEISYDEKTESECFAKEARGFLRTRIEGRKVRLEGDVSETDRYGRLLRYVYIDGTMVNLTLLEEGYAKTVTIPPDLRYADEFRKAQEVARGTKRGLWGGCE